MQSVNLSSYGAKRKRLNSEINVTPFIDVMLVLLIIFMVTAPMMLSGVEVDLPQSKAKPINDHEEPITITINKDGLTYLQEKQVTIPQLEDKLRAIFSTKKDKRIFIRGDRAADYGAVMKVFTSLKGVGLYNVALVTESEEQ